MSDRMAFLGIAAVVSALIAVAVIVRRFEPRPFSGNDLDSELEVLRTSGKLVPLELRPHEIQYLQLCLDLANTEYGHSLESVQVNPLSAADANINIYYCDLKPDGPLSQFHNSCAYTGYRNIIVLDSNYVADFNGMKTMRYDDNNNSTPLEAAVSPLIRALDEMGTYAWIWILGHEIGHLAHRHEQGHFTGANKQFDSASYSAEEREADEFAAASFDLASVGVLYFFLVDYVGTDILEQHSLERVDFDVALKNGHRVTYPRTSPAHPPIPIRLLRILEACLTNDSPEFQEVFSPDAKAQLEIIDQLITEG